MPFCNNCNQRFTLSKPETTICEQSQIPLRSRCFICDQRRRLCFRNERSLYQRKCDATGAAIISIYSPDKPYKVYKSDYWYGDKWDPLEYGRPFDFNKTFFEQYYALQLAVPRMALHNVKGVNSDFCNHTFCNKNCYLIFGGDENEDCFFGTLCMRNRDSLDLDYSDENELSYMLTDCTGMYRSIFALDCKNCSDCAFISDCTNCSECILCTNLVNKSYCIENQKYPRKEYFEKKKELLVGTFSQFQKNREKFLELRTQRIVKYAHILSSENATGDYIRNSKNCKNCFDVRESEDLENIIFGTRCKDCVNSNLIGHESEANYDLISTFHASFSKFSFFVIDSTNIEYGNIIIGCHDIFGCVGLRHKSHCILNKPYTPEQYKELREKIIKHMQKTGEWGQFFPSNLSCFAYNESTAYDYFPITREEALRLGYTWKDAHESEKRPQTFILPDSITDTPDSLVNEILSCSDCGKNFKIIAQELRFYKKMLLPVPKQCPDCRHIWRIKLRNPRHLWSRHCAYCQTEIQTSYAPDRPETVYCEKCFVQSVLAKFRNIVCTPLEKNSGVGARAKPERKHR